QLNKVPPITSCRGLDPLLEAKKASNHHQDDRPPICLHKVADSKEELGDRRHLGVHAGKDVFKFRKNECEQRKEHDLAKYQNQNRIGHGALDLSFDLGFVLQELGETIQNEVQDTAEFGSLNHIHIEATKDVGMLRHRLSQRLTALNVDGNQFEGRLQ